MKEGLSKWILSLIGIVFIGLIVDVILPSGKTKKLIKTIVATFSILAIISPLKNIDVANFNISKLFSNPMKIDDSFVASRREEKIYALKCDIEQSLKDNGFENIEVNLKYEYIEENININTIYVDLKKLVLIKKNVNIDKYTNIVAIIQQKIDVKKENIIFYE